MVANWPDRGHVVRHHPPHGDDGAANCCEVVVPVVLQAKPLASVIRGEICAAIAIRAICMTLLACWSHREFRSEVFDVDIGTTVHDDA